MICIYNFIITALKNVKENIVRKSGLTCFRTKNSRTRINYQYALGARIGLWPNSSHTQSRPICQQRRLCNRKDIITRILTFRFETILNGDANSIFISQIAVDAVTPWLAVGRNAEKFSVQTFTLLWRTHCTAASWYFVNSTMFRNGR